MNAYGPVCFASGHVVEDSSEQHDVFRKLNLIPLSDSNEIPRLRDQSDFLKWQGTRRTERGEQQSGYVLHSCSLLSPLPRCPDMLNINDILSIIGYRFGHQSGLYKSSGRNSTTFGHRNVLRVYLVFSEITKNIQYYNIYVLSKAHLLEKGCVVSRPKKRLRQA